MVDNLSSDEEIPVEDSSEELEPCNSTPSAEFYSDYHAINAVYLARISSEKTVGERQRKGASITFTGKVHFKLFDCDRPPADLCDA